MTTHVWILSHFSESQSAFKNKIALNGKYQKASQIVRINIIFLNFGFICIYLDVNEFLTVGHHEKFCNCEVRNTERAWHADDSKN